MLGRWDPFAELSRLQDEMARVTSNARRGNEAGGYAFAPPVDIYEGKDAILVRAELPGVKAEDVHINVENNVLTLSGERRFEKENDNDGWHRVESVYGSFSRSFALPNTVSSEGIEANMDAGILTLRVPKRAEAQPRRIQVNVGNTPGKKEFSARAESKSDGDKSGKGNEARA